MASRTFTSAGTNNLWSNPANWDGGTTIPADGDSVTIPSGQTCEYDYNSAYTTGIAGITITGTLSLTRTAGTYKLFMKAGTTIGGTGTFDCGTSVSPIPFTAKHTITGGSGWYIKGNDSTGLTFTCYAAEPVYKYVKLLNSEAVGSKVLEVDTDVTGDLWSDGDTIVISTNDSSVDVATIATGGIAPGSITITSGLSYAHAAGNYVILRNRNVNILGSGSGYLFNWFAANKFMVGGGAITNLGARPVYVASGEISGGVFYSSGEGITSFNNSLVSGGVFLGVTETRSFAMGMHLRMCNNLRITGGLFACQYDMLSQSSNGITILGGLFVQTILGFQSCSNLSIFGGEFVGGQRLATNISLTIKNATVRSKSNTMYTSGFTAFNTLFAGGESYLYTNLPREIYSESTDHNQVAGAYKAWTAGGVTTLQTTNNPTGFTSNMSTVLQNAAIEGYWQKEVLVGAGASVTISMALRKSASMTYLPRIIIFNKASTDPFAGGTGLNTFTMTNSVDTWEYSTYVYTNTGTADVTLVIRSQGMNATGTMLSAVKVDVINVDLTSALTKLDAIKAKTDILKNASLLIDGEIIV